MSKGKFIVETHSNTLIWSCASFRGLICNIIPQILGIWVAPHVKEACVSMWQSQDPGEQQEARGVSQLLYYAAHDLQGFLHLMSLMSHSISRLYRLPSPAWLRLHTDVDLLILQDQYGGKYWVIIHRFVFFLLLLLIKFVSSVMALDCCCRSHCQPAHSSMNDKSN